MLGSHRFADRSDGRLASSAERVYTH